MNKSFHLQTPHSAKSLTHPVAVVGAPEGKAVQVFVHSRRTGLYYPQSPFTGTVTLGDVKHRTGKYQVVAVALSGKPEWEPTASLPAGDVTPHYPVRRHGI